MHPLLRFTLDLFEQNQPLDLIETAQAAIKSRAITLLHPEPVVTLPLAQMHFRHPRASRELRLGDALVAYEFKRGQRRSIGFSVGPDGLAVRAPKWLALRDVDAALHAKAPWILRKLQETRERHARLAAHVIDWRDGATLPFLGQTITLKLDPQHRFGAAGAELVATSCAGSSGADLSAAGQVLLVGLAHTAAQAQIRDAVQAWLMRQAKQLFQQRLDHFAPLLGVQWKKLATNDCHQGK